MKKKVRSIIFLIFVFSLADISVVRAQTFEEYKKKQQQQFEKFKEEREKQLEQLAGEFDEYVKNMDKEFSDYLKNRWKEFDMFRGIEPPEEPKPDVAPVYKKSERPEPPKSLPVLTPKIKIESGVPEKPILPRIEKTEPEKFPKNSKEIDFYGYPVIFDFDKNLEQKIAGEVNEDNISLFWNDLSETNYNHLIEQLFYYKGLMNLNDWGYYLLLKKTAEKIIDSHKNSKILLTWFLLIRSGYKTKVAYLENEIFLLLPSANQLYGVNFFTLNNMNYYMLEGETKNLFTYEKDFPEAEKILNLNIYHPISLGEEILDKSINFVYRENKYPITISYNNKIINFYKDYPLADIKVYFNAAVSPYTKESLTSNLVPLTEGKTELEAANILLNLVQTSFGYKTDQEQFGYEKFFFAEEAFYYPYCDCEDRSVLFAYLIKNLLGLDVIGLSYPGHIATAINFTEETEGDYFMFNDRKYTIADPTFINAPVGLAMPQYAEMQAEIVEISNAYPEGIIEENIWQNIIAAGGNRGDNRHDIFIDEDNRYITGYFTDELKLGNKSIFSDGKPKVFITKMDKNMMPLWLNSSGGEGSAYAYSLSVDETGNTFITGSFEKEITFDNLSLKTGLAPDVFLTKYDASGNFLWANRVGIDTIDQQTFLNFVAVFDKDGLHVSTNLYFENNDFNNYGISLDESGKIFVAGAFNRTTGLNQMELTFNEIREFNPVISIKEENDRLINEEYEKTIAGLFAVVNLVKNSGISIPGKDAQETLNKHNSEFKTQSPSIYKNIGRILFLKNSDGIITVKTDNNKDVYFDMMRVKNNSKIKIATFENGDAQVDILSGVRVGKAIIWYDLNFVKMFKNTGDMLFDYDSDHTQKIMNLKKDILD